MKNYKLMKPMLAIIASSYWQKLPSRRSARKLLSDILGDDVTPCDPRFIDQHGKQQEFAQIVLVSNNHYLLTPQQAKVLTRL